MPRPLPRLTEPPTDRVRNPVAHPAAGSGSPRAPTLNTILAVREHAPSEIRDLEVEIAALQGRLSAAHARKRLLEDLLRVITSTDEPPSAGAGAIAVVR